MLVVFIWLVVLGICFAGAILLGYPESAGIKLFLTIFAIWYGIKFIFFLYNRWKAKVRVEKLINVESLQNDKKRLSYFQFLMSKDVDKHIANVIKRVTESGTSTVNELTWAMHLKLDNQHSDWLKQESVNKPKLSDPIFQEYKHVEWLVYNKFMMLDIDSYLMQQGNPSAKSEWLQLLNGLSYSAKKKSLDSLVVTVDVTELKSAAARSKVADTIRGKYEDIKEYCGVDVSVSLVLVGLEKLSGVDTWLADIAEEWQTQTLGAINKTKMHPTSLVGECFEQLQTAFVQGSLKHLVTKGFDTTVAGLPKSAEEVRVSLDAFTDRFFSPSQFQAAPVCSGLFVVMKKDNDYAFVDSLLESHALCWSPAVLTNKTTVSDLQKRKKIIAYTSASVVLASMLAMVHGNDKERLAEVFELYKQQVSKSGEQAKLVDNFQARYELIQDLSSINIGHWASSASEMFGISTLEARLNKDIADQLIDPIDANFEQKLSSIDNDNLDAKVDYLNVLMRRINILNAASQGTSLEDLTAFPQPFDSAYIDSMPSAMIDNINDIYLKSLDMTRSTDRGLYLKLWRKQVADYRDKVSELLLASDGTMDWLTDWINNNADVSSIALKDYWNGSKELSSSTEIKGVYTVAGKEAIDAFVQQLTNALGDTHPFLLEYFPPFKQQYEKSYVASWGAFLKNFNQGQESLNDRNEWLGVINNLTNTRNIFFKVLNDADFQLEPFKDMEEKPDWFEFVLYYQDMLALGNDKQGNPKKNKVLTKLALKMVGALGPVGKALAGSAKSGLKTKKKLDKAGGGGPGPTERELNLQEAAVTLDSYKTAIAELVFNIEQPRESYTNIRGYFEFENNPTASATPLGTTKLTIKKLQSLVGKAGMSTAAFWNVYSGSVALLERFMMQESVCYIDKKWEDDYLFELDGVPDYKLDTFAYADTGILWGFVNENLTPFLKKKRGGGYSLKRVDGNKMPLSADLVNYLIRAKDLSNKQKYETFDLDMTAMPTDLNEDALLYVSETRVALHCAAGDQVLVNNNYIVNSKFNWQSSCNAASVKITIGNKVIERFYGGETGVYDFLSDFKSGVKRFELEEFPEYFYILNQYKIKYLDVNLDIKGGLKLMNSLANKPPKAPEKISACWN